MLKLSLDHFSIWPPSEEVDTVQLMLNPDPAKDEVKVLENMLVGRYPSYRPQAHEVISPLVEPRGYDQSELILFRARENEVRIVRLDRRESDRPIPTRKQLLWISLDFHQC